MQIAILGRQPKLSLAELENLFGAEKITEISDYAALVTSGDPLAQARLGGTMKCARLLSRLENTDLSGAFSYLQSNIPKHLQYLSDGKLQFGVSIYGFKAQKNWLLKQMLELKKIIKKQGRSVRIIENKSEALESAQVLYNKLTGPLGWELLLIKDGNDVILAQTYAVQDIDAYAARDFGRPKRDAFVGMLPPKLAQIMINLSLNCKKPNPDNHTLQILDPFCGTGVVLQEAILMGFEVFGSDISKKMIDYTKANLTWLREEYPNQGLVLTIEAADATNHHWLEANIIDSVVCETYLGKPLTSLPDQRKLDEIMDEANTIAEGFLQNISSQLKKGTRLCVAFPAWYLGNSKFKHLKVLDHLADLGYNRLDLVHADKKDLIYHRENQVVARELTILEKK
jgi:tRNA (guanine10-N2)-dimethyltransferase